MSDARQITYRPARPPTLRSPGQRLNPAPTGRSSLASLEDLDTMKPMA